MTLSQLLESVGFGRHRELMDVVRELEMNGGPVDEYGGTPYQAAYAAMDRYDQIATEKDAEAAALEAEAFSCKPPNQALLAQAAKLRLEAVNIRALTPRGRALLDEHAIGDAYHDTVDAHETAFRL